MQEIGDGAYLCRDAEQGERPVSEVHRSGCALMSSPIKEIAYIIYTYVLQVSLYLPEMLVGTLHFSQLEAAETVDKVLHAGPGRFVHHRV